MTLIQATAVLTLWRSGQWDTLDIARALDGDSDRRVSEADVLRVLDAVRAAETASEMPMLRGAD